METLKVIRQRMEAAAKRCGRDPQTVRLIAVSKGQPPEKIGEALAAGQHDFGENYAQELAQKAGALEKEKISWHFLGHLQKNKLSKVLSRIDWLHSLDSFELATAINQRMAKSLNCFIEVKFSEEETRTGLTPEEIFELIPRLNALKKIELKGLMTLPLLTKNPEAARPVFKKLFLLLKEINQRYLYERPLTDLSMGMTHDFEVAIEEGATLIRVGEGIFGKRK